MVYLIEILKKHSHKSEKFKVEFDDHFEEADNPYYSILYLIQEAPDFYKGSKKTLTYKLLALFKEWLTPYKLHFQYCLTRAIKYYAFQVLSEPECVQMRLLGIEIFDLRTNFNTTFIKNIDIMIQNDDFKTAGEWISLLSLEEFFSVKLYLIPLLLQDRDELVLDIVHFNSDLKDDFAEYLDNLLEETFVMPSEVSYNYRKNNVNKKMRNKSYLIKFIRKLVTNYDFVENLKLNDERASMNFLSKAYIKGDLSREGFHERMIEICSHHPELKELLLHHLDQNKLDDDYDYWYNKFYDGGSVPFRNNNFRMSHENFSFHQELLFVSNNASKKAFMNYKWKKCSIIGVDTETKSSCGFPNELSIIQIATVDTVFIIDAKYICQNRFWKFLADIFDDDKILKIGFGLPSDFAAFKKMDALSEVDYSLHDWVDIFKVWDNIDADYIVKFPFAGAHDRTLKSLVKLCLGKDLNKKEQLSNWDRRPLRAAQMHYAASDAACLLTTFVKFVRICLEQNIKVHKYCSFPHSWNNIM